MNRSTMRKQKILHWLLSLLCAAVLMLAMSLPASAAGDMAYSKPGNVSLLYGITAVLSLLFLVGYCCLIHRKEIWMLLLYICVFVVNLGYFALSISKTLEEAMLANRIAYLGSVFLPLCMLMIIVNICRIRYHKGLLGVLICVSVATFLLAASGGYLPLYYKEVSLELVNGVAVLKKSYGPLHIVYLFYLITYFGLMVATIVLAVIRKRLTYYKHAVLLAGIVLSNIGVWYMEQLVQLDFEFLAISYIISELLLLLLFDILEDQPFVMLTEGRQMVIAAAVPQSCPEPTVAVPELEEVLEDEPLLPCEDIQIDLEQCPDVQLLTAREREVLGYLLQDMKRREIAEALYVSENTVKKHTTNIYMKLDVSSRKELLEKLSQTQ